MSLVVLKGLELREEELLKELEQIREARREVINRLNLNKQENWTEADEKRIEVILQNGNEGLHYE